MNSFIFRFTHTDCVMVIVQSSSYSNRSKVKNANSLLSLRKMHQLWLHQVAIWTLKYEASEPSPLWVSCPLDLWWLTDILVVLLLSEWWIRKACTKSFSCLFLSHFFFLFSLQVDSMNSLVKLTCNTFDHTSFYVTKVNEFHPVTLL